ncbi:hypothetical protein Salat_0669000 [Sesamum alatum]|uniref:Uncharacterized protein n=1 Tax=Sesamum alatum TaxID=300844 RepID=A0AAE1YRX0_9LAMI|nr:hypothetical protein Salat_0669000 [Sesamum alatum]
MSSSESSSELDSSSSCSGSTAISPFLGRGPRRPPATRDAGPRPALATSHDPLAHSVVMNARIASFQEPYVVVRLQRMWVVRLRPTLWPPPMFHPMISSQPSSTPTVAGDSTPVVALPSVEGIST